MHESIKESTIFVQLSRIDTLPVMLATNLKEKHGDHH